MPLHVASADRADHLVARLADVLAEPLADPFATEVVAVHSRGIERWLAQELSRRLGTSAAGGDGVAANLAFPFPHRLAREAVAQALGTDPEDDPWHRDRLAWRILGVLATEPRRFGPLGGAADGRRLGAARHVAGLLGRYLAHRPAMLASWLDPAVPDRDAGGARLAPHHAWQAELVRALVSSGLHDPVAEHERALARLRAGEVVLDLPPRVTVFGLTSLPVRQLRVLEALAAPRAAGAADPARAVHLLVLHPSPDLWARVAAAGVGAEVDGWPLPRTADPTAELPRNPLLASWGRDARELQLSLARPEQRAAVPAPRPVRAVREGTPSAGAPRSLLARLQDDVRRDRPLAVAPGDRALPPLAADDRSVELHDVHGELRQVEVLREVLLHLLVDDPTLEPRDVIVMCPDVERFAPLVRAVFGADDAPPSPDAVTADPTRQLRVRLADRALRETNPLLEVATTLLDLVTARRTSVQVLGLLAMDPVARRFEVDDDQLDRLTAWVAGAQVRWGLDADDRTDAGLPPIEAHSFAAGLRRMALGLAMADEELRSVGGVVPFGDVEGDDADLVGRFAEFLERLGHAHDELRGPAPIGDWCGRLAAAVDRLALAPAGAPWQRQQLHRVLDALVDEAAGPGRDVALGLDEVRALLRRRLQGAPTRSGHRTGAVTVSTLVPMRSVPHRVVVLLGLDDGRFPRRVVHDADDLLHRRPAVGDREARSEDRQLLLDALMAAGERLVVIHQGRDVRTNAELPPAVPVSELVEAIDRTVAPPAGVGPRVPASAHVRVRHHLHAHHPAAFTPGALGRHDGPWGFDEALLAAAEASTSPSRRGPQPLVQGALPAWPREDVVALDDLERFLVHPVRHFLRTRLELAFAYEADELATGMPTELVGLDRWRVGEELLAAWRAGQPMDEALAVAAGRGLLPVGGAGDDAVADVRQLAGTLVELVEQAGLVAGMRRSVEVDVALPDGRRVVGVVPDVQGWTVERVGFGRPKAAHRLTAWVRWLAVLAGTPEDHWRAVTAGTRRKGDRHRAERFVLDPDDLARSRGTDDVAAAAAGLLAELVDLRDRGLDRPPPLYADTSCDVALKLRRGWDLDRCWSWTTGRYGDNEDRDPAHVLVHGRVLPLDELLAEQVQPGDDAAGWPHAGTGLVAAWAARLWDPVDAVERWAQR